MSYLEISIILYSLRITGLGFFSLHSLTAYLSTLNCPPIIIKAKMPPNTSKKNITREERKDTNTQIIDLNAHMFIDSVEKTNLRSDFLLNFTITLKVYIF